LGSEERGVERRAVLAMTRLFAQCCAGRFPAAVGGG
jgi:hypothetical protein